MRNAGRSAAIVSVAFLAFAPRADAQQAPAAPPPEPPPPMWYEQKLIPDPFSATIAFYSNYRFRGISQTRGAPGYNGSFDFEMEVFRGISAYVGVWASNVSFLEGAAVEVDVYGGIKGKLFENLSWNLQLIGYLYPGAPGGSNLHYFEIIPSIGWDFGFMEISGGVALSPEFPGRSGFAAWFFGDIAVPVPIEGLQEFKPAVFAHIGYQTIDRNERFGVRDYLEWEVGLRWQLLGIKMNIKYGDTNLSRDACFGGLNWCKPAVVFVASKTF